MGLKARFTKQDIKLYVQTGKRKFRERIIFHLQNAGGHFINIARSKTKDQGGFGDVTGNLRSSIGFVIVDHGDVIQDYFPGDKETGRKEGLKHAEKIALEYQGGYALIVVAGMEYAASVESRGKDVITGTSLEIEDMLKEAIKKMKKTS